MCHVSGLNVGMIVMGQLPPGEWDERIVIAKPLTLEGAGWEKTIIRPNQLPPGVTPEDPDGASTLWQATRPSSNNTPVRSKDTLISLQWRIAMDFDQRSMEPCPSEAFCVPNRHQ